MKYLFLVLVSLCLLQYTSAQQRIHISLQTDQPPLLNASAGSDLNLSGADLVLGDTPAASGGMEPYSYQWLPETDLDDASSANPVYSGDQSQSYTLIVTDNRGCTAMDTINILITGVSEISNDALLVVYPNPGAGMIRLKMRENANGVSKVIRMYSSTGQLILNAQWDDVKHEYLIDVSALAAGSYVITVGEGKEILTRQLVISK